jgi:DnaJ family protein A protein 5
MKIEDEELGLEASGNLSLNEQIESEPPVEASASKLMNPTNTELFEEEQPTAPVQEHTDSAVDREQDSGSSSENEDYAPRSAVEERLANDKVDDLPSRFKASVLEDTPTTSDTDGQSPRKLGKAAQKRAKKAAQTATRQDNAGDAEFRCAVCQAGFPSKTRLFNHIKEKDHAAPVSQIKTGGKGRGKRK